MNFPEIKPQDQQALAAAYRHWNAIAKPLGALGVLEDHVARIAALTGQPQVRLNKRGVLVFCADNGVVRQGVTQTGPEVTTAVAGNIAQGKASVCRMANIAHADVTAIDMGMMTPAPGLLERRIAAGTEDISQGPAMSLSQAEQALQTGIELVGERSRQGYDILATGEMGIGNTTTASAIAAVLLDIPVEVVTGRGAGLSDAGLTRKQAAIHAALACNQPNPDDALDVLAKVGGFDIAAMAGAFIGGAIYRVPVLIDGVISAVAALVAARLAPDCVQAMLASHESAEPSAKLILSELGLTPLIQAGLRLGEGTGAVCALPLLDMALAVYNEMITFDDAGIETYTPQGGPSCASC